MLPKERYHQPQPGAVLAELHEINARCGYLRQDELRKSAAVLGVPVSLMFSAASFYATFRFKPCGRHKLQVCEGTACYVKGATALLSYLSEALGVGRIYTCKIGLESRSLGKSPRLPEGVEKLLSVLWLSFRRKPESSKFTLLKTS